MGGGNLINCQVLLTGLRELMSSANTLKQRNSMTIIILSLENSHLLQVNIIPLVTEQVYLWLL